MTKSRYLVAAVNWWAEDRDPHVCSTAETLGSWSAWNKQPAIHAKEAGLWARKASWETEFSSITEGRVNLYSVDPRKENLILYDHRRWN